MHFVTGGAFNGKGKWVYGTYQLGESHEWHWHSNYEDVLVEFAQLPITEKKVVVISGVEVVVKEMLKRFGVGQTRQEFQRFLQKGIEWEQQLLGRKLILIGSDMTKGVVPVCPDERAWRDYVGWCYQDTVKIADKFDIIWYGIKWGDSPPL